MSGGWRTPGADFSGVQQPWFSGEIAPQAQEDSTRPHSGRPWTVDHGGGTELELLWIAPGEFTIGSPNNEGGRLAEREGLQTQVRLTKGFWLGKYEVTVAQWRQFADSSGYLTDAERDA